jgi:hypothetical protein
MAGNREYFPAVRRVEASNGPRASTTIEIAQRSGIEETPGGKISEED